jgi:ribulose-phosphate 3-epimerase
MPIICPAILADEPHAFREQMERVAPFAERIQIDLTDGMFAHSKTIELERVWWVKTMLADLHLMYESPWDYIQEIVSLQPHLVIVHAEAEGDFVDFAEELHRHHIKVGVALLAETPVDTIVPSLEVIDHVMIFAGKLGHFGGKPDMRLLEKVQELKSLKPTLEIGWDGGVSDRNAQQLIEGGVDVLNVGGFIQKAKQPDEAYGKLVETLRVSK